VRLPNQTRYDLDLTPIGSRSQGRERVDRRWAVDSNRAGRADCFRHLPGLAAPVLAAGPQGDDREARPGTRARSRPPIALTRMTVAVEAA
jgi:hypothetical protein